MQWLARCEENQLHVIHNTGRLLNTSSQLRRVYTIKGMLIGSELIHNACVHTKYALTAIHIECSFGQSTSIGGMKPV